MAEKKLFAIVFSFEKFRSYLVRSYVIVHTEHADLRYILTKKDAKLGLLRWIILLPDFDLEIKDNKEIENGVADHLSKMRIDEGTLIDDSLPEEHAYMIWALHKESLALDALLAVDAMDESLPWYANVVNYLARWSGTART